MQTDDPVARAWRDFELAQRALAAAADRLRRLTGGLNVSLPAPVNRVAEIEALLRASCIERGMVLTGDGSVGEMDAGALLGLSGPTLAGWRAADGRLPWRKLSGRIQYRLADLAAFMANSEETDL